MQRGEISDMLASMPHRAPDGAASWSDGAIGLGHAARHVTPEDVHERWPLQRPDAGLCLVADARLDNRDELVAELGMGRHPRGFHTDGEIILAAYLRWREECPAHLLGDFALAVWDGSRRSLFLARDHFGAKPLFYHEAADGTLLFASEIKALFAAADISTAPDEQMVAFHLKLPVAVDGAATPYRAVKALLPAHTLVADGESVRTREFWQLDEVTELRLASDGAYAEGFRERMEAAVTARLRSLTPVGVSLSGGLDSSTIASLAAKATPGRVSSFSAIYPNVPAADERRYQRSVVEKWGLRHSEYAADSESPFADHRDIVRHLDGWQTAGNLRLNWNFYRMASEQGVNVMLEGFDGDTVVSHGIGFFGELAHRQAWSRLALEAGAHAREKGLPVLPTLWSWWSSFRFYPLLRRRGLLGRWMKLERAAARIGRGRAHPATEPSIAGCLNPEFLARIARPQYQPAPQTERAHHCRSLTRSLLAHATESLNACGAAFGVDVRFPFFDRRLVEYCVSLPPEQKIRRGLTRLVLRRGMQGIVPDLVLQRRDKANLEPGLDHALRTYDRPLLQAIAEGDALEEMSEYLDVSRSREVFARYLRGEASDHDRLYAWLILTLLLWKQDAAVTA